MLVLSFKELMKLHCLCIPSRKNYYYYYLTSRARLLVASHKSKVRAAIMMPLDIQGNVPDLPNCLLPCSCKFGSGGASCYEHAQYVHVVCILPECTSAAVLGLCGIMHLGFWTVWLSALDKLLLDNGHMR